MPFFVLTLEEAPAAPGDILRTQLLLSFTWGADAGERGVKKKKPLLIHLLGTLCNSDILLLKAQRLCSRKKLCMHECSFLKARGCRFVQVH